MHLSLKNKQTNKKNQQKNTGTDSTVNFPESEKVSISRPAGTPLPPDHNGPSTNRKRNPSEICAESPRIERSFNN